MQLENLVSQYQPLLRDALQQHFGIDADRADSILSDFLASHADNASIQEALSNPGAIPGRLVIAVRNYAFQLLNGKQESPASGNFPEVPPVTASPRFSATGTMNAEVAWALKLLAPTLSQISHSAQHYSHWQLFEASRIKPMLTGRPRPQMAQLAMELGFSSIDAAESALNEESRRWQAAVCDQLKRSIPSDIAANQSDQWFAEQHALLREVLQRMMNANFSETVDQLRSVQRLLQPTDQADKAIQPSHYQAGLRFWESYLQSRVDSWEEPIFVYDVDALLFPLQQNSPTTKNSVQAGPGGSHQVAEPADSSEQSIEEILGQLNSILASPLPSDNDLFHSPHLSPDGGPKKPSSTIGELLFSSRPTEHELRLLKDIAKQQGPDPGQPWHLAVSKLIYFATIAAFVMRINRNPEKVTSLSKSELYNAFRWAESLPRIAPQLRQLLSEAAQVLGP